MVYLIIFCLIIFVLFKIFSKFKVPKLGSLALVTGGVKCGKSTTSVYFAIKKYKSVLRQTKIINLFRKMFRKELLEIPLFYSNVPVGIPYVLVTKDILLRKKRCRYNSIIYIQEASLVADSQLKDNKDINNRLLLFNKLIAHSGVNLLIYDTQCISDIHYSIKRSLSNYFYIHHIRKCFLLPFLIVYMQEYRYSDDGSVIAVIGQEDLEENLKKVIISKKTWKMFNSHCFSSLTDYLDVEDKVIIPDKNNLKISEIISFRDDFSNLKNSKDIKKSGSDIIIVKGGLSNEKK